MRSFFSPVLLIGTIVILSIAVVGYLLFKDTTPPELVLAPETKVVAPGQKFTITASDKDSGIRSITVSIRKNSQMQTLAQNVYPTAAPTQTAEVFLKDTFLRSGAFTLIVNVTDKSFAGFGQGNSTTREFAMTMDTTPPKVVFKTSYPYVRQGGSGCVSYKVSREVEATGIRIKDMYFPGYLQENGDYICFFPFPYFIDGQDFHPDLVVTDYAGNQTVTRVPLYRLKRVFKKDIIKIDDRFFDRKMPEFQSLFPDEQSPLMLFNKVNGELRNANAQKLMELGQKSSPRPLWNDAFSPLPNAALRAGFGEHRTYTYNGEKQEVEATHLGLDMASLARSPVPAGNAGVVIYADYLGIYGNVVVLDHGLGLQSLYSHMSEILVAEGQTVARGDTLGRTGATGMAVGDHLHFGILISGMEVSPIEWLDIKWIRDNITDRLKEAETPGPEVPAAPVAAPAPVTEKPKGAEKPRGAAAPQQARPQKKR